MDRLAPPATEIIVDDWNLDKGGLEMQRGIMERLEREGRGGGGAGARRGGIPAGP